MFPALTGHLRAAICLKPQRCGSEADRPTAMLMGLRSFEEGNSEPSKYGVLEGVGRVLPRWGAQGRWSSQGAWAGREGAMHKGPPTRGAEHASVPGQKSTRGSVAGAECDWTKPGTGRKWGPCGSKDRLSSSSGGAGPPTSSRIRRLLEQQSPCVCLVPGPLPGLGSVLRSRRLCGSEFQ